MQQRQRKSAAAVRLEIAILAVIGLAIAALIRGCTA